MINYLLILLILLQCADAYTTLRILDKGGREINPIMIKLMGEFGPVAALVLVKCLFLIVIIALIRALPPWVMIILCVFYVGIVVNNLIVIRRLSSKG